MSTSIPGISSVSASSSVHSRQFLAEREIPEEGWKEFARTVKFFLDQDDEIYAELWGTAGPTSKGSFHSSKEKCWRTLNSNSVCLKYQNESHSFNELPLRIRKNITSILENAELDWMRTHNVEVSLVTIQID